MKMPSSVISQPGHTRGRALSSRANPDTNTATLRPSRRPKSEKKMLKGAIAKSHCRVDFRTFDGSA